MDHDLRIRRDETLARGTRSSKHGGHGSGHAHANGGHIAANELHGIVDGQTRAHAASRGVDVERDIFLGIGALKVQELRDNDVRDVVVDSAAQEHDAVVEQSRINVIRALAARRLLDDVRNRISVLHKCCPFILYRSRSNNTTKARFRKQEASLKDCTTFIERTSDIAALAAKPSRALHGLFEKTREIKAIRQRPRCSRPQPRQPS